MPNENSMDKNTSCFLMSCKKTTVILILLITDVGGFSSALNCRKDLECPTPQSYCLSGYCEACIPCQNFGRQAPFATGSCAKNEDDCGGCISGYEANEETQMRHAFRCNKVKEVAAAASEPPILPKSAAFIVTPITISILALFALLTVTLYSTRRKQPGSSHPNSEDPTELEERDHLDPASISNSHDEDEATSPSTSTVSANVEAPPGLYEGVEINLADHRPQTNESNQSDLLPIQNSNLTIDIDSDDTQDGLRDSTGARQYMQAFFSFFVSLKRVIV